MLKEDGRIANKKKSRLNWKCPSCKKRFSTEDLEDLGFVERIGNSMVVTCSECEYQELIQK